jgi:esterase/lipase superfamily enzyme
MYTQYFKQYSPALKRDMECKIYGHAGHPVLFIPCQDGRFYDFENYHMTDFWAPWIESGQVMVLAVDTMDQETWSYKYGDPYWRIRRHEQWNHYITDEMVPFIRQIAIEQGGQDENVGVIAFGCSLGATHAANFYFQHPDLFDGLLALSGIYTAEYGFDGYMDELVYFNSPVHYLANMPADHPFIKLYNQDSHKAIICVGQGPWELPDSTRQLQGILQDKGIHAWVDFWGYDCAHDWPWWYKQVSYFVPYLLGNK